MHFPLIKNQAIVKLPKKKRPETQRLSNNDGMNQPPSLDRGFKPNDNKSFEKPVLYYCYLFFYIFYNLFRNEWPKIIKGFLQQIL